MGLERKSADAASKKQLPTGLVYSPAYKQHDTGAGHPESPERCDAIMSALAAKEFEGKLQRIEPRMATEDEIRLCHSALYVETAKRDISSGRHVLSTGDTTVCEKSFDIALLAAGGVCSAVDEVLAGNVKNAFCVVRPPGHHAMPSIGMGFCVFNNVAIAARYAQHRHQIGKVLIVDWDVHHGNGTQTIFYEDGSVFFFSTHLFPWYPGTGSEDETGRGKGLGCILNCPFPPGADRDEIVGAFTDKLVPAADRFKPDLVMISAGFDSCEGDPLGRFRLTDDDFAELTRIVLAIAREHAGGRVISVLEGGYDLYGLATASVAHVRALRAD
jgi:acetoin utilization deacetylase AcuC-like enzyme